MGKQTQQEIFVVPPGIGDGIMGTAVALNYRRQFGVPMHIGHNCPELFEGNPDVVCHPEYAYYALTPERIAEAQDRGVVLKCLHYCEFQRIHETLPYWRYRYPFANLIAMMCGKARLTGKVDILPRIYLTEEEKTFGRCSEKQQIAIMSTGRDAYKSYPVEKMQQIVDTFPECHFVQIGAKTDPILRGVENLQGKITLRQTAAVLSNSRLFIGMVGALMHMARAVDCPSIILCPSAEPGDILHYPEFQNLQAKPGCNRCREEFISYLACWNPRKCTGNIEIDDIIVAIREELQGSKKTLEFQSLSVSHASVKGLENQEKRESAQMGPVRAYIGSHSWSFLKNRLEQQWVQLDSLHYELSFEVTEDASRKQFCVLEFEKHPHFSYVIEKIELLDEAHHLIKEMTWQELWGNGAIRGGRCFIGKEGTAYYHPRRWSDGIRACIAWQDSSIRWVVVSFNIEISPYVMEQLEGQDRHVYSAMYSGTLGECSARVARWWKNRIHWL